GTALGTPEYMAPEQVRGESVTHATDIYALGVVAYLLLAGRTPFHGENVAAILRGHLYASPPSLRAIRPDLSSYVEEVIFSALAKAPGDRPPSAGAFAQALGDACRRRLFGLSTRLCAAQESLAGALQRGETSKRRSSALLQPISRLALSRGTDALPVVASPSLQSTTSVVAIEAPTLANVESAWEALEAPTLSDVGFVHQASKAQWFMRPAARSALRAGMHVRRSWRIPLPLLAATLAVLIILGAIGSPGGFDPSGAPSAQARTSHTLPKPTATLGPSGSWLRIAPASL